MRSFVHAEQLLRPSDILGYLDAGRPERQGKDGGDILRREVRGEGLRGLSCSSCSESELELMQCFTPAIFSNAQAPCQPRLQSSSCVQMAFTSSALVFLVVFRADH
jgi:hypothetical protein